MPEKPTPAPLKRSSLPGRDFDAALAYRDQFTFGTPEYQALTGLINLFIDSDTFTHAMRSRLRDEAANAKEADL